MRGLVTYVAAMVARPLICGAIVLSLAQASFGAPDVASFYKTHNLTIIVGFSPGGGFDIYARLLAQHMGDYIPGHPHVVVQNMPGAGSETAALDILNIAPKDGATIGIFGRTVPFAPLLSDQKFDGRRFNWIGSITSDVSVCIASMASPIKSWQDMLSKTFVVGGEGYDSDLDINANLLRNVFGAKIKLVTGYPGTNDVKAAIARHEVDGVCGLSYSTLKTSYSQELRDQQIGVLVQVSLTKNPELSDIPFVGDFATPAQRQVLRLLLEPQAMARPFAAPPSIPVDRLKALRDAFDKTVRDLRFLAEAKRAQLEVQPMHGTDMMKMVADLYEIPKDIAEQSAKAIAEP